MTKTEWDRREDLRIRLAEALESEPLKQALEVCLSLEINHPQVQLSNADLLHQAAIQGASREGYFRFLRTLNALTREPAPVREDPKPWEHFLKEK